VDVKVSETWKKIRRKLEGSEKARNINERKIILSLIKFYRKTEEQRRSRTNKKICLLTQN
jgi:hypothetical protein